MIRGTLLLAAALAACTPLLAIPRPIAVADQPDEEIWQVDQLQLAPDTPESTLKALEPDHTMDAVIARLRRMGVSFRHEQAGIRAERLPPKVREQLLKLPKGEPFVLPGSDYITINVILGRNLPADIVLFTPMLPAQTSRKA